MGHFARATVLETVAEIIEAVAVMAATAANATTFCRVKLRHHTTTDDGGGQLPPNACLAPRPLPYLHVTPLHCMRSTHMV